ncbi:MAG: RNA-binding protein [Deltaproteobacteria bacterium]|nr:RNA-binding protein [Deltaproteobacteria bacterium]
MEKKIYVGGLSYSTTEQTLYEMFARIGNVESVKIITDRDTGRSKGFAFVEMASGEEAQSAIDKYNGTELDGRRLLVNAAKPQAPRSNRTGGGGGGGGGRSSWGGNGGGGNRGPRW